MQKSVTLSLVMSPDNSNIKNFKREFTNCLNSREPFMVRIPSATGTTLYIDLVGYGLFPDSCLYLNSEYCERNASMLNLINLCISLKFQCNLCELDDMLQFTFYSEKEKDILTIEGVEVQKNDCLNRKV